jgi:hypothetical protein
VEKMQGRHVTSEFCASYAVCCLFDGRVSNSVCDKIPLLKIQLMHLLCQLDKTKLKIKSH